MKVDDRLSKFEAEWTEGAWSLGKSSWGWSAFVHGYNGSCATGNGRTADEAFAKAIAEFRDKYPDEATAKRIRLAEARAEIERLEAEDIA